MQFKLPLNALDQSGCNAKFSISELNILLSRSTLLPEIEFGDATRLEADQSLYTSIDTLSPFTIDPYFYGQASVVHSITDLHAKGARPTDCNLNLMLARELPIEIGIAIIDGVADALRARQIKFGKGHSLKGSMTYLTLSVTGKSEIPQILPEQDNSYALLITKPLGASRIIFIDLLEGKVPAMKATDNILTSHESIFESLDYISAKASDITGFGLIGAIHALSIANFDITIQSSWLPIVAPHYALELDVECDTENNASVYREKVNYAIDLNAKGYNLLFGSQIAGPLLLLEKSEFAESTLSRLRANGLEEATIIGHAVHGAKSSISIV